MTTMPRSATARAKTITLWVTQVLLALFLGVASALPKLAGQSYAVQSFDEIGAGQWFRYLVGALELAGAIGLVVPALTGAAALGLVGLLLGATYFQLFVLPDPAYAVAPALLAVVCALLAWGRWPSVRALVNRVLDR
ncbi:DoxX family membrane protein [Amycolatopsis rhizosphaerae]|uniref:DoxX family membrane protein n=1 Tax=Amycolatopsis rhizosphaerae TaxID=2053003 RepID=A0A558B6E3_9PSEU|nr:DoxX family protein [Amycolatopsis rhizosphaerae]TVT32062.1 DoxX family membrane protein [Amycolatopsis rhizosphaerae]